MKFIDLRDAMPMGFTPVLETLDTSKQTSQTPQTQNNTSTPAFFCLSYSELHFFCLLCSASGISLWLRSFRAALLEIVNVLLVQVSLIYGSLWE
jgi:hypothetical protein